MGNFIRIKEAHDPPAVYVRKGSIDLVEIQEYCVKVIVNGMVLYTYPTRSDLVIEEYNRIVRELGEE